MDSLEQIIDNYGINDREKKDYEEICKKLNGQIKDELRKMLVDNKASASGSIYKVSLSITEKDDIDETKLIALLKSRGYSDCIKTIEIVDEDALEKAMYADNIDKETIADMAKITTKKKTETLRVSLIKKKGDSNDNNN